MKTLSFEKQVYNQTVTKKLNFTKRKNQKNHRLLKNRGPGALAEIPPKNNQKLVAALLHAHLPERIATCIRQWPTCGPLAIHPNLRPSFVADSEVFQKNEMNLIRCAPNDKNVPNFESSCRLFVKQVSQANRDSANRWPLSLCTFQSFDWKQPKIKNS